MAVRQLMSGESAERVRAFTSSAIQRSDDRVFAVKSASLSVDGDPVPLGDPAHQRQRRVLDRPPQRDEGPSRSRDFTPG